MIAPLLPLITREWGLTPETAGLLASAGYVGMFVGAISCGYLADVLGRRKLLMLTLTLYSVFTGLCAVAWDVWSMGVMRFIAGIGLGGALPQPGIYLSEYAPARYRGRFLGLVESSWVYGALLAMFFGWLLAPTYGWRVTFLVAFTPLVLVPVVFFAVPESIRYLEEKGRVEEALGILKRHGLLPDGGPAKPSIKELWSRFYRGRTALLWILWAVLVYTYHGIFIWLPEVYYQMGMEFAKALWFTLLVTLLQIPGYYSATFLLDVAGRKPVLASYLAAAGVGCALLGLSTRTTWVVAFSCVISFFNLGAWAGLYTYTPELYPTRIRGAGAGTAASIGRLAGIVAPYATRVLLVVGLWSAFTVFSLAHVLAAVAVLLLGVETKGRVLEEISR